MDNIFLIEDHDEALKIWRQSKVKGLDLVHIDAHIDFGFHSARPIEEVVKRAKSLKELKRNLERSLVFMRYEKDFDKQTNIGNYIYPAMEEGIVKDFYWIIPGGLKEFKGSIKLIKGILRNLAKQSNYTLCSLNFELKDGLISADLFGRKFIICILEKLPYLRQKILLDIDTDFLVIDCLENAINTTKIGKRKLEIPARDLVEHLKKKIEQPEIITISYSVNDGYTPIRYKHLGDEIAYHFSPPKFGERFKRSKQTAEYFDLFLSTGKKEYYQKAIKLDPSYRARDNNFGFLYFSLRKFSLAQAEFSKVLKVDPKNSACLLGLGNIFLEKKDFKRAKRYFLLALNSSDNPLFKETNIQSLLGLGRAEFNLKNFKKAKKLLLHYQSFKPLQPQSYYLLGRIKEFEKDFYQAADLYQKTINLGYDSIELIFRLLKISPHLKEKDGIIKLVTKKYKEFKKRFLRARRLSLEKGKKIKGLKGLQNKLLSLEKRLTQYNAKFSKQKK